MADQKKPADSQTREEKQAERAKTFEATTKKSAFSPRLTTNLTAIQVEIDQGWTLDRLINKYRVPREELEKFLQAKGLKIKQVKSKSSEMGAWKPAD